MPTQLTKPVSRETAKIVSGLPVILTIAPLGAQDEARIGVRLKGQQTQYTALLSDVYRLLALWHATKVMSAKRQARKDGVPWARARKAFLAANSI